MRKYKLEAKQYCNCEHAQMLRDAICDIAWAIRIDNTECGIKARRIIAEVLDVDEEAETDDR